MFSICACTKKKQKKREKYTSKHRHRKNDEFTKLYEEELELNKDELQRIRNIAKDKIVTLLYAAKNPKVNHVIILQRVLTRKP